MKLFLSQVDSSHWKGLVDINGETFKVTLFPGSATTGWKAVLEVGGWVELSDGTEPKQAIEKAHTEWGLVESTLQHDKVQEEIILEALKDHSELVEEFIKVLGWR